MPCLLANMLLNLAAGKAQYKPRALLAPTRLWVPANMSKLSVPQILPVASKLPQAVSVPGSGKNSASQVLRTSLSFMQVVSAL